MPQVLTNLRRYYGPKPEYKPVDYGAIRDALKAEGFTWVVAAEALGCSASNLMAVARRDGKSQRAAQGIAALIKLDVKVVFPDIPEYSQPEPKIQRRSAVEAARKRLQAAGSGVPNVKSA